jgi:hypothetical protein
MTKKRTPDSLSHACELVGRFLHYFSRVELQLDDAIVKLFKLDLKTAPIITANIDFSRKLNIVRTAVNRQQKPKGQGILSIDADNTFKRIASMNDDRQVVAHSAFESEADGVKFRRAVAKKHLRHDDPHWTEKDFKDRFAKLQTLEGELKLIVGEIEPDRILWPAGTRFLLGEPVFLTSFSDDGWLRK